jgi:hypothetical protein
MSASNSEAIGRWALWMNTWTAIGLPGLLVALLAWGPGTVVGIAVTVSVSLALCLLVSGHGRRHWDGRPAPMGGGGWIGRIALCAVGLVLSITAIGGIVPGVALVLIVLAGATTPPATDLRRRMLQQPHLARTPPADADPITTQGAARPLLWLPETARTMTDAELCRAWRRSFWTLSETHDPIVKLRIVKQRQCLLDELESRDPVALRAWLASGARACGGPERFFINDGGDQPTAA